MGAFMVSGLTLDEILLGLLFRGGRDEYDI